jgi:hypothetical protein
VGGEGSAEKCFKNNVSRLNSSVRMDDETNNFPQLTLISTKSPWPEARLVLHLRSFARRVGKRGRLTTGPRACSEEGKQRCSASKRGTVSQRQGWLCELWRGCVKKMAARG